MKVPFRVNELQDSGVLLVYSIKDQIHISPDYQRMGDIWTLEKRQLLIDSILNGFDIPKLYFHEFSSTKKVAGGSYNYSIVDGKQRLTAIWEFIENKFPLSDDFKYLRDPSINAAGMTYRDLSNEYNSLKIYFDQKSLPIYCIQTEDLELIEELFSRLNEAVPLNAAEKRNAWHGPMPKVIRGLAKHSFFTKSLPFHNVRYKHFDIATKFLLIERRNGPADTKKVYLDNLVKSFEGKKEKDAKALEAKCTPILDQMHSLFTANDPLLRSIGMITVYYLAFRDALSGGWASKITRPMFSKFDERRLSNRVAAEDSIADADYKLLEFDRLSQSPNDGVAIEFRFEILRDFLKDLAREGSKRIKNKT